MALPNIRSVKIGGLIEFIPFILLIILTVVFLVNQISGIYHVHNIFSQSSPRNTYVSDEIYYVSSSRNILVKIFNHHYNGYLLLL